MTNRLGVCGKVYMKIAVEGDWQLTSVQRHDSSMFLCARCFCHRTGMTPRDSLVSLAVIKTWHTHKQIEALLLSCFTLGMPYWLSSDIMRGSEKLIYKFCTDTEWQYSLWMLPVTLLSEKVACLWERWFVSFEWTIIRLSVYIKTWVCCYRTMVQDKLFDLFVSRDGSRFFFVPEAYSIFGALFKKNTKLQIES